MKYLFIILVYLLMILHFILDRICKILFIILCFIWDFKKSNDYSFWKNVEYVRVEGGDANWYSCSIKEYFQIPLS